jgi:hypothetical protein
MPFDIDPRLHDLHFVLRTLAVLISLGVTLYLIWQARIPEPERPSPIVRMSITASAVAMFAVAIALALFSFKSH